MEAFDLLRSNLKKDFSGLLPVRIALLGDTATQWMAQALRGCGFGQGMDLQIWEAEFSQIEQQVFDAGSELYAVEPQLILIYQSTRKLLDAYNKLAPGDRAGLAAERLKLIDSLLAAIRDRSAVPVLFYNYPEADDGVFGGYANKMESSFLFQQRQLNYELMRFGMGHDGIYIGDLAGIQQRTGRSGFFRPSLYVNTGMEIQLDALPAVAEATVAQIGALQGRIHKCLILDLDNTLWGGVIGDDGLEHIQIGALGIGKVFSDFQHWVKKLQQRGIILAVCSKNEEAIARGPFESHPDMVLTLEDIAVFLANWDNKVDNIRRIQATLNIGFDSMVFLDDNPFERNMVRELLPSVCVPELPEDPADFLETLGALQLFETASSSLEDAGRTKQYKAEQQRNADRLSFADEGAYLKSLHMVSSAGPFTPFSIPRVAQLMQRSNQFNLRTVRYSDQELARMAESPEVFSFSFTLEDRFGDNGIIAAVILKRESGDRLFVDSWLMSCRVLRRGMEEFILNTLAAEGRERGFRWLRGEYLPTGKNELVRDHYRALGFAAEGGSWILDLAVYQARPTPIQAH